MTNRESPYRVTMADFERHVTVPVDARREVLGQPAVSSPLSGDEALVMLWNSGSGIRPGDSLGCDGDGD